MASIQTSLHTATQTPTQTPIQTVVIIGAGPAGLLLAHDLLRRGNYRVEVYERRADPRLAEASSVRTFPISLQERGRKALRAIAGLEEAIAAQGVFCQGTIVYRKAKPARVISRKQPILSIDRNRLVAVLLDSLTAIADPDRLTVRFLCPCVQVDRAAHTVVLHPLEGEPMSRTYDVLVGADGARSPIREYLVEQGVIQCEQYYIADAYKSVFVGRCNPSLGLALAPDKLHTQSLDAHTRMILVPQPGDRLSGTIIFHSAHNPFAELATPEQVLTFFQTQFPTFGQLMTHNEAEALLQRPVSRVLTVRCDRFDDGDRIVLIGDAAHAVSPSIGQGCNASLEDVLILGRCLDRYPDDWGQVLSAFSRQRVPDAHALQELSNYSFPRDRHLGLEFFLRLTLSRVLHRWFPQWIKPFVFDLILDTDLSYGQVLQLSQGWIAKVKRSTPQPL